MAVPLRARLLDPDVLRHYDDLTLGVRRGMGDRPGERRFPGRPQPSGIELEAYAPYVAGDDLRHLDWNALGRLDALLVRRFTAEREVIFHLLVDSSASMGVPAEDDKLGVALELAMALAYVALSGSDAIRIALLGAQGAASPVLRQRARVLRAADFLASARADGPLALGAALEAYARSHRRPGAALVVSDFMTDPAELEHGVHALRAGRYDVLLLHVLGRGELEPERVLRSGVLADVESGETHPVALTPATLAQYRAVLAEHLAALDALAVRSGARYVRLATDRPVVGFVTGELARLGLVRRR
jgi:uncharacterized protein (DUF58 family)